MTEREIEAAFLIIEASVVSLGFNESDQEGEEVRSQIAKVVCQLFVDIHRIAEAAELTYLRSKPDFK